MSFLHAAYLRGELHFIDLDWFLSVARKMSQEQPDATVMECVKSIISQKQSSADAPTAEENLVYFMKHFDSKHIEQETDLYVVRLGIAADKLIVTIQGDAPSTDVSQVMNKLVGYFNRYRPCSLNMLTLVFQPKDVTSRIMNLPTEGEEVKQPRSCKRDLNSSYTPLDPEPGKESEPGHNSPLTTETLLSAMDKKCMEFITPQMKKQRVESGPFQKCVSDYIMGLRRNIERNEARIEELAKSESNTRKAITKDDNTIIWISAGGVVWSVKVYNDQGDLLSTRLMKGFISDIERKIMLKEGEWINISIVEHLEVERCS